MFEYVRATVNAWAFAIPNPKDTIVFLFGGIEVELLGAPNCGCRELFIDARLKNDILFSSVFFC
jgi:hypothetical protein